MRDFPVPLVKQNTMAKARSLLKVAAVSTGILCFVCFYHSLYNGVSSKGPAPPQTHPTSKFIQPLLPKCDPVGPKISASSSLSELFIKTTRILWNKDTRKLGPIVRNYWMNLIRRNRGSLEEALDDLFRVVPGRDVFAEWRKRGCLRCAVIGNSKNMLGSGYGSSIDANDVVFRMNRCPTEGYEKDVGSKTTFHVVYPESVHTYQPGGRLFLVPFKVPDLRWLTSAFTSNVAYKIPYDTYRRRPPASVDANASQVLILHPDLMYETKIGTHGRTRSYPSTGVMILFASLHLCDEVSVYGFGFGPHGEFGHYYNKSAGNPHTSHDTIVETQLRERLEKENIIRVYKGHYMHPE